MAATGSMLLCLSLLVLGVMRLPQVYGHYNDERTLNRPEYAENEVNVYSNDYTSVTEKLKDILYYESREIELTSMILPPASDTQVTDAELKEILQGELDQLYDKGILFERVDLAEYAYGYRQLRSLYPTNGDRLKGRISYWEIVFDRLENADDHIVILADAQYHKLYSLVVSGADADRLYVALQKWLIQGIWDKGRNGAQLAAELLNSLEGQLAEYYGGTVPDGSERMAEDNYAKSPKAATQNAAADGEKGAKGYLDTENPYSDIYYLENVFYNIIEDNAEEGWYVELPVSISLGDGYTMEVLSTYNYENDTYSLGTPFTVEYPQVE